MPEQKSSGSYFYFLIGFLFLFFFNGRWTLPITAFIAPVFLIRFLRLQKPFKGFLLIVLAGWFVNIFVWKGMIPMSGFFYYFLSLMMSVFTALTFLIDRIYITKVRGIISTLIFPSAYVIMDYLVISTNPSGSYGTLAHTQTSLPLIQVLSITGIWGLTFMILWTASVINWLWDYSFETGKIKKVFLVYGIPFLLIILYGQVRIHTDIQNKTVRIASVNIEKTGLHNSGKISSDSIQNRANQNFLNCVVIAAASGAKFVFGTETIINLTEADEENFIQKAKLTALENHIYLGLPMLKNRRISHNHRLKIK